MEQSEMEGQQSTLAQVVAKHLTVCGILPDGSEIFLSPWHWFPWRGSRRCHYIILCPSAGKRFFLKMAKAQDNAVFCDFFLKQLSGASGYPLYPQILIPPFSFQDERYYVTTFLKGQSVDSLPGGLSNKVWQEIADELNNRLNELSSLHAPLYSNGTEFTELGYAALLEERLSQRLKHPFFHRYPQMLLQKASENWSATLESCQFTEPTLLHMDVKPANLIYDPQTGSVGLIDFELARFGDGDYGWTQILLSGVNAFRREYGEKVVPRLTEGKLTLEDAMYVPKFRCFLFYQSTCNLIYYYGRGSECPPAFPQIFSSLLHDFSRG